MWSSVDPDEMAYSELSHQALRCLQKPIIIALTVKVMASNKLLTDNILIFKKKNIFSE